MTILWHDKLTANKSLLVTLYNSDTGSPIDITGVSALSSKAIHTESGTEVVFTATTIQDPVNGIFKLQRNISTFTEVGVYDIEIQFTDVNGEVQIHPRYPHLKLSLT